MPLVATLIADPASRALDRSLADRAATAVGGAQPRWLAEHIACDIALPDGADAGHARQRLARAPAGSPAR